MSGSLAPRCDALLSLSDLLRSPAVLLLCSVLCSVLCVALAGSDLAGSGPT